MTTRKVRFEFEFECAECNIRRKSWDAMLRHLRAHPGNAVPGYAAIYVYPREDA